MRVRRVLFTTRYIADKSLCYSYIDHAYGSLAENMYAIFPVMDLGRR